MKTGYFTTMRNEPTWIIQKAGLHLNQVMQKDVLSYELLLQNQMIDLSKSCSKLNELKAEIDERHSELVENKKNHDNAKLPDF